MEGIMQHSMASWSNIKCSVCVSRFEDRPGICNNCSSKITESYRNRARETEEELRRQIRKARETEEKLRRQITDLEKSNKKAKATEENLCSQIEDLSSTLTFLQSPPPLSDVVLVASDDSYSLPILANRAILKCRSPVFRAMLENEMQESISGIIKIGEVSYDTLGMFVDFMYTAKAILDLDKACDLLMLGDKYQIPHLKTYCERFLSSNLNWENALVIHAFARQYNSQSLLDASLSLILRDMHKLSKRQDYAQFLEKDPRMVVEIYEAYNKF